MTLAPAPHHRCPLLFGLIGVLRLALACSPAGDGSNRDAAGPSPDERVLADLPLDSLDELITAAGASVDGEITADGGGSIRFSATEPTVVGIAEVELDPVDHARLVYRAMLRSEELEGRAYLEMWCEFPEQEEYFSRALDAPLSGTQDWVAQETPFFLQEGQVPHRVRLNLVIEGRGTVWLDDVVLAVVPL